MAETNQSSIVPSHQHQHQLPPPAPPLPPSRTVLQRIIAPLSFNIGVRQHGPRSPPPAAGSPRDASTTRHTRQRSPQTASHRTSIPIAAVDLNRQKTHAVLAGQEILKTVHVDRGKIVEDYNIRSAVNHYASTHGPKSDTAHQRREYLPAKDVRWSHGTLYDTVLATAALNGRIALYDASRVNSSRIELAWIHEHNSQVHKLDFDPFEGYLLLSGSQDKSVRIWDIRQRTTVLRKQSINVRHPVRDLKWSPSDAGEFAVCTENGVIQKWDLRFPSQALLSINAHEKACYAIDWHPDGRHVVSGGFDKYVRVWDFKSDNRRQKPMLQVRTPQAIMNLRWRPAVRSSDPDGVSHWQSTQLATSYNDDDPRVHVWDLRRPLLPMRELDRHNSRPTDLLWASKDLLWTVNNQGMFTQTDVRFAPHLHEELTPCVAAFMPDGRFVSFAEDVRGQPIPGRDTNTKCLGIPRERYSGASEAMSSHSISDEELELDPLVNSSQRAQPKSSRWTKSQGNTPPSYELPHVLPLYETLSGYGRLLDHEQAGTWSTINGIATDTSLVSFLARNYARPSTIVERKNHPSKILGNLDAAFQKNAAVCDGVSLHRMAQSWRILAAIIIPELRDWADRNRRMRLNLESLRQSSADTSRTHHHGNLTLPPPQEQASTTDTPSPVPPHRMQSHLLKGVLRSDVLQNDADSTSNMTTPLAMPLPDSPVPADTGDRHYLGLDEAIESLPPLPPSVVHAHSTATAASKALAASSVTSSPPSSLEYIRTNPRSSHAHHYSGSSLTSPSSKPAASPSPQIAASGNDDDRMQNPRPTPIRTQEDRRAAIKDYRGQTRPVFTLESSVQSAKYGASWRQESAGSFPMFSASTDSSQKRRLSDQSSAFAEPNLRPRTDSDDWQSIDAERDLVGTPPLGQSRVAGQDQRLNHSGRKDSTDSTIDDPLGFSFGSDRITEPRAAASDIQLTVLTSMNSRHERDTNEVNEPQHRTGLAASSPASEQVLDCGQASDAHQARIHVSYPKRHAALRTAGTVLQDPPGKYLATEEGDLIPDDYVYSDFRPVDLSAYEPNRPLAWSALPLIAHTTACDTLGGSACAQFAVHMLQHVHPFFFNQASRSPPRHVQSVPKDLAEVAMRPGLSHKLIESLFRLHAEYLQKVALYKPLTELRNMCVELNYPAIHQAHGTDEPVGSTLGHDTSLMQVSCSQCHVLTPVGSVTCQNCSQPREVCPICLHWQTIPTGPADTVLSRHSCLWTYCHVCGHGAHLSCMEEWLLECASEGECPTTSCGCDCGPGLRRRQRITSQMAEIANTEMIRGSRGSIISKKDPRKASHSPAVDKTRDTLRNADLRERGMLRGDGRSSRPASTKDGIRGSAPLLGRHDSSTRRDGGTADRRVRLVSPVRNT